MSYRILILVCGVLLLVAIGLTAVNKQAAQMPADETTPQPATPARTGSFALGRSPSGISPGLQIGSTEYDYQKNASMNRQIGTRGAGHVLYFTWMDKPYGGSTRTVNYNAFDPASPGSPVQGVTGAIVSPSWSGYVTMDMAPDGSPIIANHYTTSATEPWVYYETSPGSGSFDPFQMPSSVYSSFLTGSASVFIWPKVAYTDDGLGTVVTHVIIGDNGDGSGDGSNKILYVRRIGTGAWETPVEIDHEVGYNLSPVIVASRKSGSQKVALAWSGGRGDGTAGGSPVPRIGGTAAGQRDNDLYLMISTDAGASWGARRNLTMRTDSLPGGYAPGPRLSALWTSDDTLHLTWMEGIWVGYEGTFGYGGRLVHWDEASDAITVAHDASWEPAYCNSGVFNLNVSNPQLSECGGNLYLTFSQYSEFNDCANSRVDGGANADIALVVSPNGGLSWDSPRNLTQTVTPYCAAGDCASEAWHSTTRYGINTNGEDFSLIEDVSDNIGGYTGDNYLFTQFIEDLDPGASIQSEGVVTDNQVKVFRFGCVEPGFPSFIRGDVNADGVVDAADGAALNDSLNSGNPLNCPPDAADVNDDGNIDYADVTYIGDFTAGGAPPPSPYPDCGQDNTLPQKGEPSEVCGGLLCGDVNGDDQVNIADFADIVDYITSGASMGKPTAGNVGGCGGVNIHDLAYMVGYLFGSLDPPTCDSAACPSDTAIAITLGQVDGQIGNGGIEPGVPVVFHIMGTNNAGVGMAGGALGFRVYSPTGSSWTGMTGMDTAGTIFGNAFVFGVSEFGITGSGADTMGFNAAWLSMFSWPNGGPDLVTAIEIGPIDSSEIGGIICIDSSWFPPENVWLWSSGASIWAASWDGPHCFDIVVEGVGCCVPPMRGNIDNDVSDDINIADLVFMVDYMFNGGPAPTCWDEAELEEPLGDQALTVADLVYLVDYMFNQGPPPIACP